MGFFGGRGNVKVGTEAWPAMTKLLMTLRLPLVTVFDRKIATVALGRWGAIHRRRQAAIMKSPNRLLVHPIRGVERAGHASTIQTRRSLSSLPATTTSSPLIAAPRIVPANKVEFSTGGQCAPLKVCASNLAMDSTASVSSPSPDKAAMANPWGFDLTSNDESSRPNDSFGRPLSRNQPAPGIDLAGMTGFNPSSLGAFPSPPIPFHDPTILPGSLPGFPPSHPLAMADPTQVLQQIAAQRAAAALMQTNLTSPWANLQANMMSNQAKAKPGRLKVQTGSSPVGSSHNSRVNTPSLPSSPLRLNHHREVEQATSTSGGSSSTAPLDYSSARTKRKTGLDKSSLGLLESKPLPEPVYHPDSAAGQSIVQEAALENLGFGMGLGGIGGAIMTPYGPLSYEMAARAGLTPGFPAWSAAQFQAGYPSLPRAAPVPHIRPNLPPSLWMSPTTVPIPKTDTQPEIGTHGVVHQKLNRTTGTSPGTPTTSTTTSAALSSFVIHLP
ncbi:hypothetical protein AG1IA_06407 [Rhizoctonia solani AG-1 IA]|uniref:Uncharacterized protein n=1 Tax=Thanatephorus cucumeris (strain AG1-IA) TaxID=983506 RepID=L8WN27_THACA|nr:hypothetical protein AG1IA_06407 [Rhizoctonia solani AG-1 IA]